MTKLCSIDSSTKKTGIAYFEDGNYSTHKLIDYSSISEAEERRDQMATEIMRTLTEYNPDIVWIEDSWNQMNIQTSKALTMIIGIVYAWCLMNKKEFHTILPSQWRKYCGIDQSKKKRTELKQASIEYVKNRYGIDVNDDVADAISLGDGVCNYFALIED